MGLVLLLDRFHVIDIRFVNVLWPIAMFFGLLMVVRGYTDTNRGKVFWGTIVFFYALFFFLRSVDSWYVDSILLAPSSFLIVGIAFLMMYFTDFRDWALLIPSAALITLGGMLVLAELGYWYRWEVWDVVRTYWPIVLILMGLAFVLRRRSRMHESELPPHSQPTLQS
jgi:hypothetical protein